MCLLVLDCATVSADLRLKVVGDVERVEAITEKDLSLSLVCPVYDGERSRHLKRGEPPRVS